MMAETKIEWCDKVLNPNTGCSKISAGCANCYAERIANRFWGGRKFTDVKCHPERLEQPLKWKKPQKIFVNSMSDLFHPDVPDEYISKVWDVMWAAKQHTFLILTKRPERMKKWVQENAYSKHFGWVEEERVPFEPGDLIYIDDLWMRNMCGWESAGKCECNGGYICGYPPDKYSEKCEHGNRLCMSKNCPIAIDNPSKEVLEANGLGGQYEIDDDGYSVDCEWMELHTRPRNAFAQNVWLGVTAENQQTADERIPILLQIPAAVRFVSVEPMLGAVDLSCLSLGGGMFLNAFSGRRKCYNEYGGMWNIPNDYCKLNWVICGGETGPGARPMHPDWVRSLRDQCVAAGVPFFFKSWGEFIVPEDGERACRVCGCTQNNACEDGCYWVEDNLCNKCVGKPEPNERAVKYLRVGKKAAGALIDGQEWRRFPETTRK
jgi:protein gp37